MLTAVLFTMAKIRKQFIHQQTNALRRHNTHTHTHTHTHEYYSATKRNEILPFPTIQMDLEGIMPSEISQPEKDKHCISPVCGI